MAKIPIILEPGRADGKLANSDAIFDENKGMFQSEINDIQDTLNSDNTNKPLSAKQGKVLKELLDTKVIEAGDVPFDTEPTEGNTSNVVTSDGIYKALAKKVNDITFKEKNETQDTKLFELEKKVDGKVVELSHDIESLNTNTGVSEYPTFDEAKAYAVGEVVLYEGLLKRFTSTHEAGAWDGSHVEDWSERKNNIKKIIASKVVDGYFIDTAGVPNANELRSYAYYPIKGVKKIKINVPKTATAYSLLFAYADDINKIIRPIEPIPSPELVTDYEFNVQLEKFTYIVINYTTAAGIPIVTFNRIDEIEEDISNNQESIANLNKQVDGINNYLNGKELLQASKVVDGYFIDTAGVPNANELRSYAYYPIKGVKKIKINVPKTATAYSLLFAYADDIEGGIITPKEPLSPPTIVDNYEFEITTENHSYLCISYTTAGGLPNVLLLEGLETDILEIVEASLEEICVTKLTRTLDIASISKGNFIDYANLNLQTSSTRSVAFVNIKNVNKRIKITIPKEGNSYSMTYAFSNDINPTIFIRPENPIRGSNKEEQTILVENVYNYGYLAITYTTANGVPIVELESEYESLMHQEDSAQYNILRVIDSIRNDKTELITDKIKSLKILFVANSFSLQSCELLPNLFKQFGYDVTIGISYIGGGTLEQYCARTIVDNTTEDQYCKYIDGEWKYWTTENTITKSTLAEKLADENWDVIVFTQGSAYAGLYSSYEPYYERLRRWLYNKAKSIGYYTLWMMPWAWTDEKISGGENMDGGITNLEMYNNICEATQAHINHHQEIDMLLPCGTAVENQLKHYTQDEIWIDGQHVGIVGYYASALAIFGTLAPIFCNTNLAAVKFTDELQVSKAVFETSLESAKNAIANPYTMNIETIKT